MSSWLTLLSLWNDPFLSSRNTLPWTVLFLILLTTQAFFCWLNVKSFYFFCFQPICARFLSVSLVDSSKVSFLSSLSISSLYLECLAYSYLVYLWIFLNLRLSYWYLFLLFYVVLLFLLPCLFQSIWSFNILAFLFSQGSMSYAACCSMPKISCFIYFCLTL